MDVRQTAGWFDHRSSDRCGYSCVSSDDTMAPIWRGLWNLTQRVFRILRRPGPRDRSRVVRLSAPDSRVRFGGAAALPSWFSATAVLHSPPTQHPIVDRHVRAIACV